MPVYVIIASLNLFKGLRCESQEKFTKVESVLCLLKNVFFLSFYKNT